MHFLNFKATKKIATHLKKFLGMQNVVSKLFLYLKFAYIAYILISADFPAGSANRPIYLFYTAGSIDTALKTSQSCQVMSRLSFGGHAVFITSILTILA